MNFKKYFYVVLLLQMIFVTACYTEEELTPSGEITSYTLPQGDHDYDDVIMSYYEKYGSCLLYKFTDKDVYWTPTAWMNGALGENGKQGYIVYAPDENYIGDQLEVLEDLWFSHYSDEFLSKFLPVTVFLCSEIDSVQTTFVWTPSFHTEYTGKKVDAYYNYENIAVARGNASAAQMTAEEKLIFRDKINRVFVESILERGLAEPLKEFEEVVNYNTTGLSSKTRPELWKLGIPRQVNYAVNVEGDWESFILMMIGHSEEFLTREPQYTSDYDDKEKNWDGILNPAKDVNGLLKKRYDMVRNYFIENYNMDLQSVGNGLYE